MIDPTNKQDLKELISIKGREFYWTITRTLGLSSLHGRSFDEFDFFKTNGYVKLLQQRTKEFFWTITRIFGLSYLHDGSRIQAKTSEVQALLQAVNELQFRFSKIDSLQINSDILRIQSDFSRFQRDDIINTLNNQAYTIRELQNQLIDLQTSVNFITLKDRVLFRELQNQLIDLQTSVNFITLKDRVLFRSPHGILIAPIEDSRLTTALWTSPARQLESGTMKVIDSILNPGDFAIDVGANIGFILLPMASKVGPDGHIVAIEPGSRASQLLREMIIINGLDNRVELQVCAAGEHHNTANLHIGDTLGHSSLLDIHETNEFEEVKVIPLDALVAKGQKVNLVKIDVEGFELQVWKGMSRILSDNPELTAIVEFGPSHLMRSGENIDGWIDNFIADGFTIYEINETTGDITPLRTKSELSSITSINLLMLRKPTDYFPLLNVERH